MRSNHFKDAIRLFATNTDVKDYNFLKLEDLRQPVALNYIALNYSEAKSGAAELANRPEKLFLRLSIGCQVVLRVNL